MRHHPIYSIITLFLFSFLLLSCSNDRPDIIQTKSGLYGSSEGKFLAKFPCEPGVSIQNNSWGSESIETVTFNTNLGGEHYYVVSYTDLPKAILESWDVESLFDQSTKTMVATFGNFSVSERSEVKLHGFEKCVNYTLSSTSKDINSVVYLRLAKNGTRIYTVSFAGLRRIPESSKINEFIESFRLYEPNETAK